MNGKKSDEIQRELTDQNTAPKQDQKSAAETEPYQETATFVPVVCSTEPGKSSKNWTPEKDDWVKSNDTTAFRYGREWVGQIVRQLVYTKKNIEKNRWRVKWKFVIKRGTNGAITYQPKNRTLNISRCHFDKYDEIPEQFQNIRRRRLQSRLITMAKNELI